jgi:hypothetical protein
VLTAPLIIEQCTRIVISEPIPNRYWGRVSIFDKLWINTKVSILTGVGRQPMTADFIRGDGTSYTGISLGGLYEFEIILVLLRNTSTLIAQL